MSGSIDAIDVEDMVVAANTRQRDWRTCSCFAHITAFMRTVETNVSLMARSSSDRSERRTTAKDRYQGVARLTGDGLLLNTLVGLKAPMIPAVHWRLAIVALIATLLYS